MALITPYRWLSVEAVSAMGDAAARKLFNDPSATMIGLM